MFDSQVPLNQGQAAIKETNCLPAACGNDAACGIDFKVQALCIELTCGHLSGAQHAGHIGT